jgi:CubicO group peptidase (beta-lactamase class C family)
VLIVGWAAAAGSEPEWPDTDLSKRVQAWFTQLAGDEEEARVFFQDNFTAQSLTEITIESRLARRKSMLSRIGGLTAVTVLEATPTSMRIATQAVSGEEPTLEVEADEAPPHLIKAINLKMAPPPGPGGPPATPEPPLSDEEAVRQLRAHFDESAAAGRFSGAVMLARGSQPILRQGWGLADREKAIPCTPETLFNLGSLGKTATRLAMAQLIQQGKVQVDDKLSEYLPDFPRANEITIEMLLQHRSGVGDVFNERFKKMDRSTLRRNHDYLELIKDQPLTFDPGTKQHYSTGGFILLGEVIGKVMRMDYFDYLGEYIYRPAGMTRSAALVEGDGTANVARGYTAGGVANGEEHDNVNMRAACGSAAGGIYSTADDLMALDRALFEGKLCTREWAAWVCAGGKASPDSGFSLSSGDPGIATEWIHKGELLLIVLANRDPKPTQVVLKPAMAIFRRMQPKSRG